MLRMQDITKNDMSLFVDGSIGRDRAFLDLSETSPVEAGLFMEDVVNKVNGVFIWVSVVTKLVLLSLDEGDGLEQLYSVLHSLPQDIEDLYSKIWNSISGHESVSAQLVVLKRTAERALDFERLWLAEDGFAQTARSRTLGHMSAIARGALRRTMIRRLDRRTRGILELSMSGHVDFIHRTPSDWAASPQVQIHMTSQLPMDFDPSLRLLQVESNHLGPEGIDKTVTCVFQYARKVRDSSSNRSLLVKTMDEFDLQVLDLDKWVYHFDPLKNNDSPVNSRHFRDAVRNMFKPLSKQIRPRGQGGKVSFYYFACRFCIIPYIEGKMESDSQLLRSPALTSALTEVLYGLDLLHLRNTGPLGIPPISLDCKKETVAFLLARGAALGNLDKIMLNSELEVSRQRAQDSKLSPEGKEFWTEIHSLMLEAKRTQSERQSRPKHYGRMVKESVA